MIDGDLSVSSNIFPIQKFNTSVYITEGHDPEFNVKILFGQSAELLNELSFNIARKDLKFEGEMITPFKEYSSVRFTGYLVEQGQTGVYKASGNVFKNMLPHSFEGDVTLYKNLPTQADFVIKDLIGSNTILHYNLEFEDMKRTIKTKISKDDDFISFESMFYIQNLMDWAYNIRILSSKTELNELMLSTALTPFAESKYESSFEMITPWPTYFIDSVNVSSVLKLHSTDGNFKLIYQISQLKGSSGFSWKWIHRQLRQDYQLNVFTENQDKSKSFSTDIGYLNTAKFPTDARFSVDVNSVWALKSTAKFDVKNLKNMSLIYELHLPVPVKSRHKLAATYMGQEFPPKIEEGSHADFQMIYDNELFMADVKAVTNIKTFSNIKNQFSLEWGAKNELSKIVSDLNLEPVNDKIECRWEVLTPYVIDEKTFKLYTKYFTQDVFKIVHVTMHAPQSRKITVGDVAFADFSNMKGSVNCSLPIFNLTWFDLNFDFDSHGQESAKFIKATWPENHALLDSKSTFVDQKKHKKWKGTIKTELPLHTMHNLQIIYGLEVSFTHEINRSLVN